jgi:hypothetical protein
MARRLDSFPEDEDAPRGRYPWGKWLNGEVWELQKGSKEQVAEGNADYAVETRSFRSAVQQATRVRKGDVKTAIRNSGTSIVIQFVPKDESLSETLDEGDGHAT